MKHIYKEMNINPYEKQSFSRIDLCNDTKYRYSYEPTKVYVVRDYLEKPCLISNYPLFFRESCEKPYAFGARTLFELSPLSLRASTKGNLHIPNART